MQKHFLDPATNMLSVSVFILCNFSCFRVFFFKFSFLYPFLYTVIFIHLPLFAFYPFSLFLNSPISLSSCTCFPFQNSIIDWHSFPFFMFSVLSPPTSGSHPFVNRARGAGGRVRIFIESSRETVAACKNRGLSSICYGVK